MSELWVSTQESLPVIQERNRIHAGQRRHDAFVVH